MLTPYLDGRQTVQWRPTSARLALAQAQSQEYVSFRSDWFPECGAGFMAMFTR